MDTSETYIKMCDCLEVQGKRRVILRSIFGESTDIDWVDGDWLIDSDGEIQVIGAVDKCEFYVYGGNPVGQWCPKTWLPRQDQIQEMLVGGFPNITLLKLFHDFWYPMRSELLISDITFEQIWLRFWMLEQYGMEWNGEKWLKRPTNV